MGNLVHALDTWNNGFLIKEKLPPRNKSGLKKYTKGYGTKAKEFGLLDITFNDVITAYSSLPYSLPEFKIFEIPNQTKPLIQGIDEKTSAIAAILDFYNKGGKPETIYEADDPYWIEAQLMISYKDAATELFARSTRLQQLFPSPAGFWGCLLVGQMRFWLEDSGVSDFMILSVLPDTIAPSKREITSSVSEALPSMEGKERTNRKSEIPIGCEPFILFRQEIKAKQRSKRFQDETLTPMISRIKALNRAVERNKSCKYISVTPNGTLSR
mgnify:CR=1 FL=1